MQLRRLFCCLLVVFATTSVLAQQTGSLHGKVTASDGSALPGVTVEAKSVSLPQPRVTVTDGTGTYRLPQLQPGTYTLQYTLSGMQTTTRRAEVLLDQDAAIDIKLGVSGVSENITVTAQATLVDRQSTALQSGLSSRQITELPVTQNFSDLQKLIPGVMYNPDTVRGPSAGASGQDNVYMFDGVNITMPLFGVLNTDPNNHDIAQVTVIRGGAKAVDFNRAGGFLIDTVSKSGTNKFSGEAGYEVLNKSFIADQSGTQLLTYNQDSSWATLNFGGPILSDRLFFYGSYYRPKFQKSNQANVYGDLPGYTLDRRDVRGKLTFTPTAAWLINGSYYDSHTDQTASSFGTFVAPTSGTGFTGSQKISTLETSWIINAKSYATGKIYDYKNPGSGTSDQIASVIPAYAKGTHIDIANLGSLGRLTVPTPIGSTNPAQTAFVTPFVNQYGYNCPAGQSTCVVGAKTGGGTVGFGLFSHDDDSFYRKDAQVGYNYILGSNITHDLHFGFQHYKDSEDRFQTSNGWGAISIPAGVGTAGTCPATACGTATPAFFVAQVSQQGASGVPTIHSEIVSQNIELNDTIHMNNWTFNAGLIASEDTLYGQGLAKADNLAGFIGAPGVKYLMHHFSFKDMLQPRLAATWAYNGTDTIWTSFGRYMPPANSDARAASWDRNLVAQQNVYFDANGNLIGIAPNASSSGKWWEDGIKHPELKEYMIGTSRQLNNHWSARFYTRARKGDHYLEDTNNTARVDFAPPAGSVPATPYVPNLTAIRGAIGSGSSYVIANLDNAFTKYYEATVESEYHSDRLTLTPSYTWSHYYGNFDQDNSSTPQVGGDDAAVFIGSSNIGDGAGRQLWNNKYGDLRGDRRNVLKLTGTYALPWRATMGAFAIWQSGQPYQLESVLPYRPLTGSTSDTNRYAEPAGRRVSPAHHQLDLDYTQHFPLPRGFEFQLEARVFNVTNNQTGFNYETRIGVLGFTQDKSKPTVAIPDTISDATLKALLTPTGTFVRTDWAVNAPFANNFYAPRRFQLTGRISF